MAQTSIPSRAARFQPRLWAEIWLWRHGLAWPLAVSMFAATLALALWVRQPAEQQTARLRAELAAPAALPPRAAAAAPAADPAAALRSLLANPESPAAQVRQVVAIARRHRIELPRGQYAETGFGASGLAHTELNLRFVAGYPQARAFIEALLRELPNASIERVSFERDQVQGPEAEVSLRLTLWRWPRPGPAASRAGGG